MKNPSQICHKSGIKYYSTSISLVVSSFTKLDATKVQSNLILMSEFHKEIVKNIIQYIVVRAILHYE